MNYFYQITEQLNTNLKAKGFRTVSYGDVSETELNRQDLYPIAYVIPGRARRIRQAMEFSFTIIGVDLVDFNKDNIQDKTERFYRTDNLQDVHQDILARLDSAMELLLNYLDSEVAVSYDEPDYEPFQERFDNMLAGWACEVVITTPKLSDGIC